MLYSASHNVVLYPTDEPLRYIAAVPEAKRIGDGWIGVPARLNTLQALRKLGEEVPSPLECDGYDWPIKRPWKPLTHQKITAAFLALHPRCFCLNDMGTMKTLSALWAADYLMEIERRKGKRLRALIVAPLSILRVVWEEAIFRNFLGRRTSAIVHGSAEKRRKQLEKDVDFYIINHDGLAVGLPHNRKSPLEGLAKDLHARTDIQLAIVDEASVYRDAGTRRHRAARLLLGSREYLWLMTGTPTPNGPVDAYGLAKLINNANGESFTSYKNRVMLQVANFKWVPRVGAAASARALLQPAVRYAIEDCVDLPPCTVQQREAELSKEQIDAFRTLKREAVMSMANGAIVHAVNEAALRTKLIQTVCGAIYDGTHASHDLNPAGRIGVLEEIIEGTSRKVVVFAPLTNVLNLLYSKLDKHNRAIINGAVKGDERREIFKRFGNPDDPLRVLLADPATISHGVNDLVTADVVVWYGPTDKTEHYLQGNKRIDRPGQTVRTTIVQIVASKIEREIFARLENNESLQGVILKLAEEKI